MVDLLAFAFRPSTNWAMEVHSNSGGTRFLRAGARWDRLLQGLTIPVPERGWDGNEKRLTGLKHLNGTQW